MNFNVGIYVRLSREDEIKTSDTSESIKNQKEYILKYVKENNLNLVEIYSDDGFSGTNFDRPGFKKLITDIEAGKINMVITKDLSRLGRDHIETGNLLEKYFPLHGVRYVAINDSYDSFLEDSNSNDFAPFRNVFNDMYAKDISKKVRTALHTKQLKGEFLGTSAPIGYMKSKENKNKLVINPKTEYIVKKIFSDFLSGKGINEITKDLIRDNIPTPSELSGTQNNVKEKGIWNATTVRRILKNEVYIGNTVGGKVKKINYKLKKQSGISKDKWIKIENTHESIISKKDFEKVQNILNKRSYTSKAGSYHLLTGLIYCAVCGSKFTFVNGYKKKSYYAICRNVKAYGKKLGICSNNTIKESILENAVIHSLKEIAKTYANEEYILSNINRKNQYDLLKENFIKEKEQLEIKLNQNENILFNLYKDKVNGLIDEQIFIGFSKQSNEEKNVYINQLEDINSKIEKLNNDEKYSNDTNKLLKQLLNFENINRNILLQLVDKIVIDNTVKPSKIIIYFKFGIGKEN